MGLYTRKDSPFWWYWLEGTHQGGSTKVRVRAATKEQEKELKQQAQTIYLSKQSRSAQIHAGLIVSRPIICYRDFSTWFKLHDVAHHRGAAKETSILRQLLLYFSRVSDLSAITADTVKEWMTWRKREVQPSTVNRELDVLKRLLQAAVPKYLEASPITGMRRFRVEEHEPRVLTHEEERRLMAVCDPEDTAWLLMALDTLMRLSNVVNLKWDQVKKAQQTIIPLNAKVKHDVVPMTTRMLKALKALPTDTDWVFPRFHLEGSGPTAAKNRAIRRFDLLCQQAGIPHGRAAHGVTFHCLRHTGATRALQRGASVRTVMKLGGWKDERSVMRYVHAADSDVREAAESIGRLTSRLR